jgi:hypothetical protein
MIGELGAAFRSFGEGGKLRRVKVEKEVPGAWDLQIAGSSLLWS